MGIGRAGMPTACPWEPHVCRYTRPPPLPFLSAGQRRSAAARRGGVRCLADVAANVTIPRASRGHLGAGRAAGWRMLGQGMRDQAIRSGRRVAQPASSHSPARHSLAPPSALVASDHHGLAQTWRATVLVPPRLCSGRATPPGRPRKSRMSFPPPLFRLRSIVGLPATVPARTPLSWKP